MTLLSEVKKNCEHYNIEPSKSKGQNFLIKQTVLNKIVKAADLTKEDYILEIGPGFGILTRELIKNTKKVLTVELDKRIAKFLQTNLQDENLIIFNDNILELPNSLLFEKLVGQKGEYKVVANIPYLITKVLLRKFLSSAPKPKLMVLLIQKEVAEKIVAKQGKNSLLSLSVKFYAEVQIIDYVSKDSFFPQPKVDSAIIKIKIDDQNYSSIVKDFIKVNRLKLEEKKFWQMLKIGFSSPRKQLHNNLANGYKITKENVKEKLSRIGLRADIRPGDLTLIDWLKFYQQLVV